MTDLEQHKAIFVFIYSFFFFFKQKTAYEMAQCDWSSDVCSSDLMAVLRFARFMHAEDPRHELPPEHLFCGRRQRPIPYIFGADEIQHLIACARQLGPPGSLRS